MDVVALNPYSRSFYEYLRDHRPDLAERSAVDHAHHWDRGALSVVVNEQLSLSTHEHELTISFGPTHVHRDDFADALETLRQIENEELIAFEWREEEKVLGASLRPPNEVAIPASMLLFGTPTQVRVVSFRGTFDAVRVP